MDDEGKSSAKRPKLDGKRAGGRRSSASSSAPEEETKTAPSNAANSPQEGEFEQVDRTLLVGKLGGVSDSTKIAAFDMDWTLIRTKTGRTFPSNEHDW